MRHPCRLSARYPLRCWSAAAAAHLQEAYDALDDPRARGQVAALLARTLLFTGQPSEARVVAGRAMSALGPEDGELARALETLELTTYFFGGGGPELLARMEEYRRPPAVPGPGAKALASVASYDWANRGGAADECAALALAALEDGELLSLESGLVVLIATVTLGLTDRREALDSLAVLEADSHRRGSLLDISSVHLWLGHALWRHGQLEEAAELLRTSTEEFVTYGLGEGPSAYGQAFLCQTLVEQGDLAGARRALERSLDTGDASDGPRCACSAGSSATRALTTWRRRSPCWRTAQPGSSTPRRWSRSARRSGMPGGRPTHVSRCAPRSSWRPPAARRPWPTPRARSCTRPAPRPRTEALSGVAALTASERRIADLAAAGETNRDIAQALYVTPKTVEVHLSNAYRKLGVRSRRELPGVLTG